MPKCHNLKPKLHIITADIQFINAMNEKKYVNDDALCVYLMDSVWVGYYGESTQWGHFPPKK